MAEEREKEQTACKPRPGNRKTTVLGATATAKKAARATGTCFGSRDGGGIMTAKPHPVPTMVTATADALGAPKTRA